MEENTCRVCLQQSSCGMQSIYKKGKIGKEIMALVDMLNFCTNLGIKKADDENDQICMTCIKDLSLAYTFIQKCLNSNTALKSRKTCMKPEPTIVIEEVFLEDDLQFQTNISLPSKKPIDSSRPLDLNEIEIEFLEEDVYDDSFDMIEEVNVPSPSIVVVKDIDEKEEPEKKMDVGTKLADKKIAVIPTTSRVNSELALDQFKCALCNMEFSSGQELIDHGEVHIVDGKKRKSNFQCHVCLHILSSYNTYRDHIDVHAINKYRCKICGMGFNTRFRYASHVTTSHPDDNTPFQCPYCPKIFMRQSILDSHILVHTGEKPYKCDICHYSARIKENLKVHMRSHTGDRPYTCDYCDKSFTRSDSLKMHTKIHLGIKSHQCDVCNKCFVSRGQLREHRTIHDAQRQKFSCDICQKEFTLTKTMRNHRKTHFPSDDHICDICGKSFTQRCYLQKHKTYTHTNSDYHCAICYKIYNSKRSLALHRRLHEEKKDGDNIIYKCELCHRTFSKLLALTAHRRSHKELLTVPCDVCASQFENTNSMLTHRNRFHRDAPPINLKPSVEEEIEEEGEEYDHIEFAEEGEIPDDVLDTTQEIEEVAIGTELYVSDE